MKKNKLITLLMTFSKEEMKKFEKFIASPYFNNERNFKPLYKILKQYHPDFDNPNLTEEKLFKKLYPKKTYEEKSVVSLRVLESQMARMAEKFLVNESFDIEKDFEFSKKLAMILLEKGLTHNSFKTCMKSSDMLDQSTRNIEYLEKRLQMNELLFTIDIQRNPGRADYELTTNDPLITFAIFFDRLCRFVLHLVGRERAFNKPQLSLNTMRDLINNFDPVSFENNFKDDNMGTKQFAMMNFHLCKTRLNNEDSQSFMYAVNFYYKNFDSFHHFYKWAFFLRLHSFANTKAMDIDYPKYGMIANNLCDLVLEKKIHSHVKGHYLAFMGCLNIFWFKFAFLNSENLDKFIKECIEIIHPDEKVELCDYMNVFLFFSNKQFHKTIEAISVLGRSANFSKNIIHMLKLAALYECGNYEQAIMEIDSHEHYLRKNKNVASNAKNRGLSFNNAILTFIKFNTHDNYYDKDSVIQKIKSGELRCHLYSWLIEKADEFLLRSKPDSKQKIK